MSFVERAVKLSTDYRLYVNRFFLLDHCVSEWLRVLFVRLGNKHDKVYLLLNTAYCSCCYRLSTQGRSKGGPWVSPLPRHLCDILTDKQWHWNRVLFHPNFFLFCNSSPFPFSSSRSISLFSTLKGYCNLCTCTLILPTSMVTDTRTKWTLNRLIWINIT